MKEHHSNWKRNWKRNLFAGLIGSFGLIMIWLPLSLHSSYMNSEDVTRFCSQPFRTSLMKVLDSARSLGFLEINRGLGETEFQLYSRVEASNHKIIGHGIEEGYVEVSKPFLPPFMKQTCRMKFRNEQLVSAKRWVSF